MSNPAASYWIRVDAVVAETLATMTHAARRIPEVAAALRDRTTSTPAAAFPEGIMAHLAPGVEARPIDPFATYEAKLAIAAELVEAIRLWVRHQPSPAYGVIPRVLEAYDAAIAALPADPA